MKQKQLHTHIHTQYKQSTKYKAYNTKHTKQNEAYKINIKIKQKQI